MPNMEEIKEQETLIEQETERHKKFLEKEAQDRDAEAAKDSSDTFMQDYLTNLRRGLEGYSASVGNYMDEFTRNMDKHKDQVVKSVDEQVSMINKRMKDLGIVRQKIEERSTLSPKAEEQTESGMPVQDLRMIISQLQNILEQIEKK